MSSSVRSTRPASAFVLLLIVTTLNRVSSAEFESITWPKDAEVEYHYRRLLTEQTATPAPVPPSLQETITVSPVAGSGGRNITCDGPIVVTTGNGNASAGPQCPPLDFTSLLFPGAQACREAISKSFGAGCGGNVYASVVAATQTCTKAAVRVMMVNFSKSNTTQLGTNTRTCALACCRSKAIAPSFAIMAAEALSQALSCSTGVQAYLKTDAYSQSWVAAFIAAYNYACSNGGGDAYFRVDGMAEAFSLRLIKIFAKIQALACSSPGCTSCSYCPPAGTISTEEAMGISVNGARTLATSYSDAAAQLCHGKERSLDVIRTKLYGCLEVAADTSAAAMMKLSDVAGCCIQTNVGTVPCAWTKGSAHSLSIARATVNTAEYAFAQTFANTCPGIKLPATQFISEDAFQDCQVKAVQQMCTAKGITLATLLASCLKEKGSSVVTNLSYAFSQVIDVKGCNCKGADWCCTTCTPDTCDLYK